MADDTSQIVERLNRGAFDRGETDYETARLLGDAADTIESLGRERDEFRWNWLTSDRDARAAEQRAEALEAALREIVAVYNDDSLTNSGAQDRTDGIARAALSPQQQDPPEKLTRPAADNPTKSTSEENTLRNAVAEEIERLRAGAFYEGGAAVAERLIARLQAILDSDTRGGS